jgi:hypothetical protein
MMIQFLGAVFVCLFYSEIRLKKSISERRVLFGLEADSLFVLFLAPGQQLVRFSLGWVIVVRVVQEILDPKKNLLDSNGGLPAFFLAVGYRSEGGGVG